MSQLLVLSLILRVQKDTSSGSTPNLWHLHLLMHLLRLLLYPGTICFQSVEDQEPKTNQPLIGIREVEKKVALLTPRWT